MKPARRSAERLQRATDMAVAGGIRPERACMQKSRYLSQNDARHACKLLGDKTDRPHAPYHCPFCGHWHVAKLKHGEGAA